MKKIYMIVPSVKENRGGMTMAMLNRSRAFYNHSYPADIITFDYNLDYAQVINNLTTFNKMDKRTNIHNIFNFFEKKSRRKKNLFRTEKEYNKLLKAMNRLAEIKRSKNSSGYYSKETGEYTFFVRTKKSEIDYVDYYKQNKRYKRVNFSQKIKRLTEYFNENNKKINEIYFNEKEQPYLNITIHPKEQNTININLIAEKIRFKNKKAFKVYFIESLLNDRNKNILMCDGPGNIPEMIGVKMKNVKKVAIIHTNHFSRPFKYGSPLKKRIRKILKSAKKLDNIVVFTKKQKKDIKKQFNIKNIKVIPNFQTVSKVLKKQKSDNIVGHVSRLVKTKGFDRLLKVAKLVNEKDPSIKFHLYGLGVYEDRILEDINNKNLNDVVKLKGYTNNIKSALATFDISVSTSYYEAFGLSISESMEQRVPVIAMDINYGPSDLIENEVNGYLIVDNDIEDMAGKIVELIQNKKKIKEFGKKGRKKILNDLDSNIIMQKWEDIL